MRPYSWASRSGGIVNLLYIDTFMEAYNFDGKTVIPFATSGGSGLGDAGKNMQSLAKGAKVEQGKRFGSGVSADELKQWADRLI